MEATLVDATNKRFWRRLYGTVRILLTTTSLPTSPCHDPLIPSAPIPTQLTHKIYTQVLLKLFATCTQFSSPRSTWQRAHTHMACSVFKIGPSYELHFEGLSNFNPSNARLVQIQDVNLRI